LEKIIIDSKAYADHDILYLLYKTAKKYNGLYEIEIQSILYMLVLIRLFKEQRAISNKNYDFIMSDKRPYSTEINSSLKQLNKFSMIKKINEKYMIEESGINFANMFIDFDMFKESKNIIDILVYCLQKSSIVSLAYNIENETMVNDMNNQPSNRFIIDRKSSSIELIYNDFDALKSLFSNSEVDIVALVSVWIQYIIETNTEVRFDGY